MIKKSLKKRIESLEERHGNIDKAIYEQKIKDFFKKHEGMGVPTFIALLFDKSDPSNPELLQRLREKGAREEIKEIWELGEKLTKENKL